jgi:hypothetical protein
MPGKKPVRKMATEQERRNYKECNEREEKKTKCIMEWIQ